MLEKSARINPQKLRMEKYEATRRRLEYPLHLFHCASPSASAALPPLCMCFGKWGGSNRRECAGLYFAWGATSCTRTFSLLLRIKLLLLPHLIPHPKYFIFLHLKEASVRLLYWYSLPRLLGCWWRRGEYFVSPRFCWACTASALKQRLFYYS